LIGPFWPVPRDVDWVEGPRMGNFDDNLWGISMTGGNFTSQPRISKRGVSAAFGIGLQLGKRSSDLLTQDFDL